MHKFHSIAALCGEGLRPELRELFEWLAIDPHSGLHIRHDGMVQAGPDPVSKASTRTEDRNIGVSYMSKESENKETVGRWFTDFWGETCNLNIVDELAAPDMLLQYSLHELRRGRDDIKAFMIDFRKAFPDLNFWGTADLIAEGDYVVGRWEGGGTHTGPAFRDFLAGSLPANTGRKMRFTGTTVLKLKNGMIVEEIGLDDGVAALTQLGLIKTAA